MNVKRSRTKNAKSRIMMLVASFAIALVGMMAVTQPAYASDDESHYFNLSGVPYNGDFGIYATPGEKLVLKAQVYSGDPWGGGEAVNGATYKWKFSSKVKAKTSGAKATIKRLPGKGKYSFTVAAYNKAGKKLFAQKYTINVKKNPGVKIAVSAMTSQGKKTVKSLKKGERFMIEMKNAYFGWNNNKKTFYTWTVEKDGKTASWNTKSGSFKKNALVEAGSVAGGAWPIMMGSFKQKGTYTITATVYHSNKKIQTVKRTIAVK